MPSAPEFLNGHGNIRIAEVFQEIEAEHPAHADGHVRIAGEVVINLQGVEQRRRPGIQRAHLLRREGEQTVCGDRQHIGKNHLFAQAVNKAPEALCEILSSRVSILNLRLDVDVAHNRARDQLREEGDVQHQIQQVLLDFDLSSVQVNDIAHGLEGEEGDADGKRNIRHRNRDRRQKPVQRPEEEIAVLEIA